MSNLKNNDFHCNKCGNCCRNLQPFSIVIFPSDVSSISEHLNVSNKIFLQKFCTSKNICIESQNIRIFYMNILSNGNCPFLNNNTCSIHEYKPIQCKRTPFNFFFYKELWEYMPCFDKTKDFDQTSYNKDMELMKEVICGYNF